MKENETLLVLMNFKITLTRKVVFPEINTLTDLH